jgi:hypothetical protein
MKLRLTTKQIEVMEKVWQSLRVNFADLPSRTTVSLIRRGLLEKYRLFRPDGIGIGFTIPGIFVARELFGLDKE